MAAEVLHPGEGLRVVLERQDPGADRAEVRYEVDLGLAFGGDADSGHDDVIAAGREIADDAGEVGNLLELDFDAELLAHGVRDVDIQSNRVIGAFFEELDRCVGDVRAYRERAVLKLLDAGDVDFSGIARVFCSCGIAAVAVLVVVIVAASSKGQGGCYQQRQ
jgi:hypothetical protein